MSRELDLVEQVLAGESRELQLLAAQGILPLPAEHLVPLQISLADSAQPEIAGYARAALAEIDPRWAGPYLEQSAPPDVLAWFVRYSTDPAILEVLLRRRDTPRGLLAEVAARIGPDLQEMLLQRQDAIVEWPEILDTLEANPTLSVYARRRIAEYREHLVPRFRPVLEAAIEVAAHEFTAEELRLIEEAKATKRVGELDERTGLSEGQIRALPMPVRLKLTKGASRTLRMILVRDTNPIIALAVLTNSHLSDDEVEQIAASRSVEDEVLTAIATKREWVGKYNVCLALVRNPRTMLGIAVRLVSRLSVRDLRILARDRNVADSVRTTAMRLYKIKAR